jgi:hypothetical protein
MSLQKYNHKIIVRVGRATAGEKCIGGVVGTWIV